MSLDRLIDLDRAATLSLNSLHSPASDQFWLFFSDVQIWFPAYLIVAILLFVRLGKSRGLIILLSLILTVVFCDQISSLIKNSVERLRPCYDAVMISGGLHCPEARGGFFGFFSGHASNAFGFITCLCIGLKNDRTRNYTGLVIGGYLWATLVALSRVMMGKHFLGDILVGTLFGLLSGYMFGMLARWAIRRFVPTEAE